MPKQRQESLCKKPTHGVALTISLALLFDSRFLDKEPKSYDLELLLFPSMFWFFSKTALIQSHICLYN